MNLLATPARRRILFAGLYFSEGAPIGYIWWALPTKLRAAGVPVEQITAITGTLVLVWALKFLWAPAVDVLRGPRWDLRAWIVAAQLGMGLALVPLIWLPLATAWPWVFGLLLAHALLAATQDVAIDALCIASVAEDERGSINGWMQVGMLTGRAIFGGAVLWLEGFVFWTPAMTIGLLLGCIWSTTVLVTFAQPSVNASSPQRAQHPARRFVVTLRNVLTRRTTLLGLVFALIGAAAFEGVGGVAGVLLIDAGLSADRVGMFFAAPVVIGMAAGALAGGYVSDRLGVVATVMWLTFGVSIVVSGVAACVQFQAPPPTLIGVLSVLYVLIGAFTAASYALFMRITDPALGGTQFSAFMGATNLCESWAVFAVGRVAASDGYAAAFLLLASVSLASLVPLWGIARTLRRRTASSPA